MGQRGTGGKQQVHREPQWPSQPYTPTSRPGLQMPPFLPREAGPKPATLWGGALTRQHQEAVPARSTSPGAPGALSKQERPRVTISRLLLM